MAIYVNGTALGCGAVYVNGTQVNVYVNGTNVHSARCDPLACWYGGQAWGATEFLQYHGNGQWTFNNPSPVHWCLNGGGGGGAVYQTSNTGFLWNCGSGKAGWPVSQSNLGAGAYAIQLGNRGAGASAPANQDPAYINGGSGGHSYFVGVTAYGGEGACAQEAPSSCHYYYPDQRAYDSCRQQDSTVYRDGVASLSLYNHLVSGGQGSPTGPGGNTSLQDHGGGIYTVQGSAPHLRGAGGGASTLSNNIYAGHSAGSGGEGQFYAEWGVLEFKEIKEEDIIQMPIVPKPEGWELKDGPFAEFKLEMK